MIIKPKGDARIYEGKKISFGPDTDDVIQLELPKIVTRSVDYEDLGFKADYTFTFDGRNLKLDSMTVFEVTTEEGLSTRALTQLRIPEVMQGIVYEYNPILSATVKRGEKTAGVLAQIYWAEFVCNGSPRRAVMDHMGWSRTNANYHLTKLSKAGLIPADRDRNRVTK